MDWDDENDDTSVSGGILRAVGTGMLIVCLAFAGKAVFGGAGLAMDYVATAAFAGIVGTVAMVGAAAADRECRGSEEGEAANPCRVSETVSPAMPGPVIGAVVEATESCERRFTAKLAGENRRHGGRGV